MAGSPPQMLRKPIRELLHKRGEPMSQEIKLQDRGDEVRMPLIKAAYEQYDEVPETATQWFDPQQNAVVIPLPDPNPTDTQLDFDSFSGLGLEGNGSVEGSEGQQVGSKPCHDQESTPEDMNRVTAGEGEDR